MSNRRYGMQFPRQQGLIVIVYTAPEDVHPNLNLYPSHYSIIPMKYSLKSIVGIANSAFSLAGSTIDSIDHGNEIEIYHPHDVVLRVTFPRKIPNDAVFYDSYAYKKRAFAHKTRKIA